MNKSNSGKNKLEKMRHSCAHVLAAAIKKIYSDVKFGIGPVIENGFYYDFEFKKPISKSDLPKIEQKMAKLIKKRVPFEKKQISIKEAKKLFANQPYKLELIEELASKNLPKKGAAAPKIGRKSKVSIYTIGEFSDLCKGPHLKNTAKIGPFKLLKIAGAYWRGDEKNKMLTRIYGTCFSTQRELDQHLKQLQEAKKRDHRKIGKKLDLFHFSSIAPGMPFWHPKGVVIWNELLKFWREVQKKYHYQEVRAPELLSIDVFKQSGHWDHYQDYMFFTEWSKNEKYALKPMDCPGEIEIYKKKIRSYRHLPLRFAEIGLVHRKEKKGELHGLFRVAHVTQDDAHIFAAENQIQKEVTQVIKLAKEIYKPFKLKYDIFLSTRPSNFAGNIRSWNKAEEALKKALEANKISFEIKEGEGAFYGPKIDYDLKDALGRAWQCATIQLDFFMPEQFKLTYVGQNGKEKRPVMIHRTIMGAIERFIGILIEHYAGALPTWLSPLQVKIIPIADRHQKYAKKVFNKLFAENIRVEIDDRSEKMEAKIREATLQKVPFMIIIGEKEIRNSKFEIRNLDRWIVSVRTREGKDLGQMKLAEFIQKIQKKIEKKT